MMVNLINITCKLKTNCITKKKIKKKTISFHSFPNSNELHFNFHPIGLVIFLGGQSDLTYYEPLIASCGASGRD
jgi:hypothetical protein